MVGKKLLKIHKEQIRLHALPVKLNTVAEWLSGWWAALTATMRYALCACAPMNLYFVCVTFPHSWMLPCKFSHEAYIYIPDLVAQISTTLISY